MEAAVTINRTEAVVSIVSKVAFAMPFRVMERYRTRPRNSDQITAATAASVGVNNPSVMPPIRMTGAIRAMTAEKSKYQSSARRIASAMPIATLVDRPNWTMAQTATGNIMTTMTSTVAFPSWRQENGLSLPQPFL